MSRKSAAILTGILMAARQRKRQAEENCAHWDYESYGDGGHDCCYEYAEARLAVKAARKALERAQP